MTVARCSLIQAVIHDATRQPPGHIDGIVGTRTALFVFSVKTVKMISEKGWLTFMTGRNAFKWSDLTMAAALLFAAYLGYWIYGYIQVRMVRVLSSTVINMHIG